MGIPGIISVMALVFAMTGGAYAAKDAIDGKANNSAKAKQGKRGPRGPAGPAGAAGLAGAAGAKGDKGDKGDAGAQGLQGPKGDKGDPGDPWALGSTLPPDATISGTWAGQTDVAETDFAPISFSIPLSGELEEDNVTLLSLGGGGTGDCPGTVEDPQAAAGHLCVYQGSGAALGASPLAIFKPTNVTEEVGASVAGAVVLITGPDGGFSYGTWAVTGE